MLGLRKKHRQLTTNTKRSHHFVGHIKRRGKLKQKLDNGTNGKIDRKRNRGEQEKMIL